MNQSANTAAAPPYVLTRSLEMAALCTGVLAVSLVEQMFARLSWEKEVSYTDPFTQMVSSAPHWDYPNPAWFRASLLVAACVTLLVFAILWRWRRSLGPIPGSIVALLKCDRRLGVTVLCFIAGTMTAAAVRFALGNVAVADFATGSAPLIAGLLIGVMFDGLGDLDRHRQAALMYALMGAIATALGTIGSDGWFFGSCFIIICGSLASSSYLVMDIVIGKSSSPSPLPVLVERRES